MKRMPATQHSRRLCFVFSGILLVAASILVGCGPKNPLDRTVDASNPGTYLAWWKHERRRLPQGLEAELDDAFRAINNSIVRRYAVDLNSSNDPFCVKVNGLTLRDVLIDAYLQENEVLLKRISLGTTNLATLTKNPAFDDDAKTSKRRDYVIKQQEEIITVWKTALEHNQARITELQSSAPR